MWHKRPRGSVNPLIWSALVACGAVGWGPSEAVAEQPYPVAWARQLGTSSYDNGYSVAVDDDGSAIISGTTEGSLGGVNAGHRDAFLAKYDSSGGLLWKQQLGTSDDDESFAVAADGAGNVLVSGTSGWLYPDTYDAFLAKYGSSGNFLWMRQLGTSSSEDCKSVAVDSAGNAFVAGRTDGSLDGANAGNTDAFLAKYDSSGNLLWIQQPGTPSTELGSGVAVDGDGNAFLTGYTCGTLGAASAGKSDAFLAKYDPSGKLLWTEQLGTPDWDESRSVAVDGEGNAIISGYTEGDLVGPNAGNRDAFVAKYRSSGGLLWTRQLGTPEWDESFSVAVDGDGNALVTGYTNSILGEAGLGLRDAFLTKYDPAGDLLWIHQLGTSSNDTSNSVAVDGAGNAFIGGFTRGSLGGANAGDWDAFLVKYEVPEPAALALLVLGGTALGRRRHRG